MSNPTDTPAFNNNEPTGFLRNVNLVLLTTVVVYALAFFTSVLMARGLRPDDPTLTPDQAADAAARALGTTALYQSAVGLAFAFFSLGLAAAVVYYIARREMSARGALEAGLSVTLVATLLTAAVVLIASVAFSNDLADVPYWLAVVAVPAVIQYRIVEAVLRAQGRFGAMNALELSLPICVIAVLAAVEITTGLTVRNAIVAWSLAFLPPLAFGYILVGVHAWPRRLTGFGALKPTLHFGVQSQLSNLLQLLNYRLDAYLVLFLVNAAGVGFYTIGVRLSEGMWFVSNAVTVVLLTNLTSADEAYAQRMTPVVCRNTLLITAGGALLAGIIAPVIVPLLFSDDYKDAVVPFLWLLPGTVALAGAKVLAAYVFSRGKPLINAWIAFWTLIVTIVADLILIPIFEVPGAAAGASIAYILNLALTALAYRRLSGASIADALIPRPADAALYIDGLKSMLGRFANRSRAAEPRP